MKKHWREINKNDFKKCLVIRGEGTGQKGKDGSLTSPNAFWYIFCLCNLIVNIQNVKLKLKTQSQNTENKVKWMNIIVHQITDIIERILFQMTLDIVLTIYPNKIRSKYKHYCKTT